VRGHLGARLVPHRGAAIVVALSATVTVSYGVLLYAFPVLFVPMRDELGLTASQLSLAATIGLGTSALAGIWIGWLLDHRDPRVVMTAGSALATVGVILWSRVHSAAALYAVFVVVGVAMAAVTYGAAFTVVAKWFTGRLTAALTAITVAGAFASLIFSPLTELLSAQLGWRDALVVLAIVLGIVTIPPHLLVLRPHPPHVVARASSVPAREALRTSLFWLLAGAFALGTFAWSAMTVHLVVIVVEQGHPAGFAAFAAGLTGISQLPGRLLFGPVAARLGQRAALPVAFGACAMALALLAVDQSRAAVVTFAVLFGIGGGMMTMLSATAPAALFGPASYGAVAGVLGACINGARALGPLGAAAGVLLLGGYLPVAAVLAAALVVAAVTAPLVTGRRARAARPPAPPGP
jgi:MFS family permease